MATILSWNVNGLRSVSGKGFLDWLGASGADIVCLQETRVLPTELKEDLLRPFGYHSYWHPAAKKGYSGTGVYSKEPPEGVETMGIEAFDAEGRVQVLHYPAFTVLNGYWPNSQDERARLAYKLEFVAAITKLANKLVKQGRHVLLCGDFNIAHEPIDLARPKDNEHSAGYYIEEREAMAKFLEAGYVDTFRHFVKEPGHYSWWSFRARARERNVGWRIDYHCVDAALLPRVKRAWIEPGVMGSDHCPVGIEIV